MATRYCVTGATGFIGSHLVASLKADGHWVRAIDIQERPDRAPLYAQADEVWIRDLRVPRATVALLRGAERVYHLAADHGGAGYFHSDHDQPAARNNMQMDLNVLHACEHGDVERWFYASSACAYPIDIQTFDRHRDLAEETLFTGTPEQCYGAQKRFMTLLCDSGCQDARAGVFHTIYGPLQTSEGIRAKFPTAIIRRALEAAHDGPPEEGIELWGDGTQIRTFLYIDDAVRRIRQVMEQDDYAGPVNIASDEKVTVGECAQWACEDAGTPAKFNYRSDMPTGVQTRTPNLDKWRRVYGPTEQTSTRDGFRKLAESMTREAATKAAA